MKRATRAVMTAAAVPLAAALPLALGGGALPTAAASALIPEGPATVLHHGPTPWAMSGNLDGAVCAAPKACREVYYDWIQPMGLIEFGVQENVRRLDWAIHHVGTDPKIVYAFSGGARIASVWLKDHADDADAPAPEDLSFVLLGNGGRRYGGVNGWMYGDLLSTPTDTQYEILDVTGEYDPISDFPSNPFNLLALANGIAAFQYVHLRYDEADLDDPDNIVWREGNTTYVFIPTERLPLLQPFYDAGLGDLVKDYEPRLREIIDSAYKRTWMEGKEPQGEQATGSETASSMAATETSADTGSKSLLRAAAAADKTDAATDAKSDEAGREGADTEDEPGTEVSTGGSATVDAPEESDGGDSSRERSPEVTGTSAVDTSDDGGDTADETDRKPATSAPADGSTPSDDVVSSTGRHRAPRNGTKKADRAGTAAGTATGSATADSGSGSGSGSGSDG